LGVDVGASAVWPLGSTSDEVPSCGPYIGTNLSIEPSDLKSRIDSGVDVQMLGFAAARLGGGVEHSVLNFQHGSWTPILDFYGRLFLFYGRIIVALPTEGDPSSLFDYLKLSIGIGGF
jgi:hypothetical protein